MSAMWPEPFVKFHESMQNEALAPYRTHLRRRRADLALKRAFDILTALVCLTALLPLYLLAAAAVALTSPGPVFYRQLRVGRGGEPFAVLKFRTMRTGADRAGELTVGRRDARITPVGRVLRATNFDEFPQMLQVLAGCMSVVGIRPEVPRYVACYAPEDFATLLMKPGMASPAAIAYRHENDRLARAADPEKAYREEILPAKMRLNRAYVAGFSFVGDLRILARTLRCVFEKDPALADGNGAPSRSGQ